MKFYNRVLLSLSIVLLIFCCLIIAYALHSKDSVFEFGSISDCISSMSALGTFIIACMAFKKAPEWINQRMHEDAFSMAKKIMFDDYPALKEKIDIAGALIDHYVLQVEFISDELDSFISLDDCNTSLSVFREIKQTPSTITNSLRNLAKLGWDMSSEFSKLNSEINVLYYKLQEYNNVAFVGVKKILASKDKVVKEKFAKISIENFEKFQRHEKEFDILYKKLMIMHKRIPDYFEIGKI